MIAAIIPTLNEEKSIEQVIKGFPCIYRDHEIKIYVIDGGSTDSTREIAENAGAEIIEQRLGGGKGDGMREAFEKVDADIYVMIDGDQTYDPSEVGKLLDPIFDKGAEQVIGWRKNREEGAIPRLNLFGNRIFNLITRISTGKGINDMLSGYRAFTHESLKHTGMTSPGFGIETEMTFSALENNIPIEEVPISYKKRKGKSKLHPVKDGWRIVKTIIWSIRDLKPLKFFSAAALILFVMAGYPAYIVIGQRLQYGQIQDVAPALFASVLIIIGIQLLIFGMISDQIKNVEKRLKSQI